MLAAACCLSPGRLFKYPLIVGLLLTSLVTQAGEWSGHIGLELRQFFSAPLYAGQSDNNQSLSFSPDYYQQWQDGKYSLSFNPYIRVDSSDARRSHADVRELLWLMVGDDWELRVGVGRLFWGVTESQHLVDIINQSDSVDDLDGEQKLGQAMIDLSLIRDWGTVDVILLPGFRPRTFPGAGGRLRYPLVINTDTALYEASAGARHVDIALRWFQSYADWDIGVSFFKGTAREPILTTLTPYYEQIQQWGLDVQLTTDAWLWKLEAVQRDSQSGAMQALTGGAEYTYYAIFDSGIDMGLISEYLYDSRAKLAPTPFENDLMVGMRLAWNNVQSSDVLLGVIVDLETSATAFNIEASSRIGASWKLSLRARGFTGLKSGDFYFPLRNDSHLQLDLARYF